MNHDRTKGGPRTAAGIPRSDRGTAVVLLSGGLDSTTVAAWAQAEGFQVSALTVAYGQRHRGEVEAARAVAARLGITDHVAPLWR